MQVSDISYHHRIVWILTEVSWAAESPIHVILRVGSLQRRKENILEIPLCLKGNILRFIFQFENQSSDL